MSTTSLNPLVFEDCVLTAVAEVSKALDDAGLNPLVFEDCVLTKDRLGRVA